MSIRSGLIVLLGLILAAGCSKQKRSYRPQSLKTIPYRPWKTLIPTEDTWYNPKHTEVIQTRNLKQRMSSEARISRKEHWGHMAHRLRSGDSLYSLARRYYSDVGYWRLILDTNRSELPNPQQLPRGRFIYLPMTPLQNPDGSFRSPPCRPDYYVLGSGDTLAKVSHIFLGNPQDYQRIAHFNNLPDPNRIQAGQFIALPRQE